MALGPQDVEKIAHLARLALDEQDIPLYTKHLSDILAFVEQMDGVDTAAVEPLAHPLDTHQRLRPDEVTEVDQREHFQATAPGVEAGLYLVPRVIE
ncbi:MAG: Asp-tRNA(Asn)/Glu-tRNA(Gln) amidotransferase subunit GatC [Gammaproteobacteria bacterium]|nr:Asp-tRNA(Asn)/Glu-tRNA(Gln) amidotransferase subunit GatC [Gammaproteobacteria bacterium]